MSVSLEHEPAHDSARRRLSPGRILARLTIVVVVLGLVAAGGLFAARRMLASTEGSDYPGQGTGAVSVRIRTGDTAAEIGATLVNSGVVKSVAAFRRAATAQTRARSLQPGFYTLRMHMGAAAALSLLLDPASRLRGRVTIPEGSPLAKTLARLSAGTRVAAAAYAAALAKPTGLGLPAYADGRPEGFLFPATYDVEPGTSAATVLAKMTHQFAVQAAAVDLTDAARAVGMTPYQVLTVASLVEAETPLDADRAKVARVVYNRLAKGQRLGLDSTLNYVLPQRKGHLSRADQDFASPYNTYRHAGLPPTPINSPGREALAAALHPAAGNWVYFLTVDKQGHSLFTDSYSAFLDAKAKAQREGVY